MSSKEKILAAVKNNQPLFAGLPPLLFPLPSSPPPLAGAASEENLAEKFMTILQSIGGASFVIQDLGQINAIIKEQYPGAKKIVSACPGVEGTAVAGPGDPHALADIDLAIIRAHFGVAENAACWVTEDLLIERALPFICQHLAIVIDKKQIVPTMHQAYDLIADTSYDFGTFIAGPSKTADIEQSLVLGAHGPKSMIMFLFESHP